MPMNGLIADLQMKLALVESQIKQMIPIANHLAQQMMIQGHFHADSASLNAPSPANPGSPETVLLNQLSNGVLPVSQAEDWIKSAEKQAAKEPKTTTDALAVTPIEFGDSDRIFNESESKEKENSVWRHLSSRVIRSSTNVKAKTPQVGVRSVPRQSLTPDDVPDKHVRSSLNIASPSQPRPLDGSTHVLKPWHNSRRRFSDFDQPVRSSNSIASEKQITSPLKIAAAIEPPEADECETKSIQATPVFARRSTPKAIAFESKIEIMDIATTDKEVPPKAVETVEAKPEAKWSWTGTDDNNVSTAEKAELLASTAVLAIREEDEDSKRPSIPSQPLDARKNISPAAARLAKQFPQENLQRSSTITESLKSFASMSAAGSALDSFESISKGPSKLHRSNSRDSWKMDSGSHGMPGHSLNNAAVYKSLRASVAANSRRMKDETGTPVSASRSGNSVFLTVPASIGSLSPGDVGKSDTLGPAFEGERQHSSRSRATSIYSAVFGAAAIAKYNEKGSLASLNEQEKSTFPRLEKQASVKRESLMRLFLRMGLNPLSTINVNWDFAMALIYITILWIIPLEMALQLYLDPAFSIFLTVIFLLDVILEFLTFRKSRLTCADSKTVFTLRDWQQHYLKTTFILDLISSVPFELLNSEHAEYLWIIRFLRLHKLTGIMTTNPKFVAIRKAIQSALGIGQTFSVVFPLMFCLCAFLHLQACALFLVGRLQGFTNPSIAEVQFDALAAKYTWAIYTAVGNTFPMFYRPSSTMEKCVVIAFSIVGAGLYASIVGTISSFAMGVNASGRLYKQKIDELKEYMRYKDLSDITRRKIMKYYEIKYRGKFFEERDLLADMNDSLRMEISVHNCRQLISKVNFLRREAGDGRDDVFAGRLATALTAEYFVPGDLIINAGDVGNEMYFILTGTVGIYVNGVRVGKLADGAFFGELALLANIPRTATVQAASSCALYKLTRSDFMRILIEFDDMREKITHIYRERMDKFKAEEQVRRSIVARS
ncbi:hypothetical protein HDU78_004520 [Chytriomyces hyalinus]|nr:hypothetical protein HDU78_004520 [Chytriomyces hyalinus]